MIRDASEAFSINHQTWGDDTVELDRLLQDIDSYGRRRMANIIGERTEENVNTLDNHKHLIVLVAPISGHAFYSPKCKHVRRGYQGP